MNKITRKKAEALAEQRPEIAISIYMPTHRFPTPPHMQEDQTRFKNLTAKAKKEAEQQGYGQIARNIHEQLEQKLHDIDFWRQCTEGMAIFASDEQLDLYYLPVECEEHVQVGQMFDITPLLVLLSYDQPYYVLAIAAHNPKFFSGDMYGLEPVEMNFPSSPEEALNIDEMFSGSKTVRGREGSGRLAEAISPHGQGDSNDAGREERLDFFRIIDHKINQSKDIDKRRPILLAGTDNDVGDYRALSELPALLEGFLQGNYTAVKVHDLRSHAWPLVQKESDGKQTSTSLDKFNKQFGAQKSSGDLSGIEKAAEQGRVATLLLGVMTRTADSVSDSSRSDIPKIIFNDNYERLANLARAVFAQGGKVIGLLPETMPHHVPAAALYRY